MKLLLTSAGFANEFIVNALLELTGKPFNELNLVDIPTAANTEKGDKSWLTDGFNKCKELGFAHIDIVDISAVSINVWEPKLNKANVLLFGGGNTFYLLDWLNKSGLRELLPEMLKNKVYMGISAGSYVACPDISSAQWKHMEDQNIVGLKDLRGLGLVNFLISPHYIPEHEAIINENKDKVPYPIFALTDSQAILVDGDNVKFIGSGEFKKFNSGFHNY